MWYWVLLGLLIPTLSLAGDITLHWEAAPGATGYEIEQSIDAGTTWTKVADLTATVCTPAGCSIALTAPAAGRTLYRFVAKNAAGRTIRYDAGTWSCESCKPPANLGKVGIQ